MEIMRFNVWLNVFFIWLNIFYCVFKFGYEKFHMAKENVGIFAKMAKTISTVEGA